MRRVHLEPWYRRGSVAVPAAVVVPVLAAGALVSLRSSVSTIDLAVLMVSAVVAVAALGSRAAAGVAAVSAAGAFDYFLTHPYGSLTIASGRDQVTTLLVLVSGLVVGELAARAARGSVELVVVLFAAGLSQAVPEPGRWAIGYHGLDAVLAVLVFATALGVGPGALGALHAYRRRIAVSLLSTATLLPALAWVSSRLVADPLLRHGVLALGIAPAEIGSVATTGIGSGDPAMAATLLIGSTLLTLALGPPVLASLAKGAAVHPASILASLALVVAVPMAAGVGVRAVVAPSRRAVAAAQKVALGAVVILVALVASEVVLTGAYLGVLLAVSVFLGGSTLLGVGLGVGAPRPVATGVLLTTAMRDFAVAAAIAGAAFGAGAAAPLSLYGVLAIVWGVAAAGTRRRGYSPRRQVSTGRVRHAPRPVVDGAPQEFPP